MASATAQQPAFNNRHANYRLIKHDGENRIVYRLPDDGPYPEAIIEALRIIIKNPCPHLPTLFDIQPNQVIAEYLDGYVPLSKAGVTSAQYNLFGQTPRRFKRWRIRKDQQDMANHFDSFIVQLQTLAAYFKEHGLWHGDVIPQNVMWNRHTHHMKLIDICALCPIQYVKDGARDYYDDGRTAGVYLRDYAVDRQYVRDVFLQDLAPWPAVMMRKLGFGIKK